MAAVSVKRSIERDGINATKVKPARIHFFSDVFVAVAVVVAEAPYYE